MASNIRLVIADVDGTLVTQEKILTPRAIEAVKQLKSAGIAFSITSGRPPLGMKMLIEPLGLTEPIAAFNGGVFIHPDLSALAQSFVPPDIAGKVIETIGRHGLDCWVYTDRDWLVRATNAPHVAREEWTVKFPPTVVSEFCSHLDRVAKIVGVSDDDSGVARAETDVQHEYGTRVSAARSQPYYLDVTHPYANKGHVVEVLSQALAIPSAHESGSSPGKVPNTG